MINLCDTGTQYEPVDHFDEPSLWLAHAYVMQRRDGHVRHIGSNNTVHYIRTIDACVIIIS